MTPTLTPDALARLRERLDARCAFGMNGATWMILRAPDPDCAEASAAILALESERDSAVATAGDRLIELAEVHSRATAAEARLLEIARIVHEVRFGAGRSIAFELQTIAAIVRSKPAEGEG